MISIMRISTDLDRDSGSRLNSDFLEKPPFNSDGRRFIIIKKIDPKDYDEDRGVEDMAKTFKLEDIEKEIPPEVDSMDDDYIDAFDMDIDGLDIDQDFDEEISDDDDDEIEVSEDDLDSIEKDIPSEIDSLEDDDLESDSDLDPDTSTDEKLEETQLLDEKESLNDYL